MCDKKSFRKKVREIKKQYSLQQLRILSAKITDKILNEDFWKKAKIVLLYSPLSDEVDVTPLILDAKKNNKNVVLPIVSGENLKLGFFSDFDALTKGSFNIFEPSVADFPKEKYSEIELAFIPGMAFDKNFNRLGRGKGFYDKFLNEICNAKKIGICFPFQVFEQIPHEDYDVKMDFLYY